MVNDTLFKDLLQHDLLRVNNYFVQKLPIMIAEFQKHTLAAKRGCNGMRRL